MADSPVLGLKLIAAGQVSPEIPHNQTVYYVDALLFASVEDRDLTTPPAASDGALYIVGASATGDWSGHDGKLALMTSGAWKFFTPKEGFRAWIKDEDVTVTYNGTAWKAAVGDTVFFGRRTSNQTLTGSMAGVQWNSHPKYPSGTFTHSTSSNTDQITLKESGDYEVHFNLTADYSSGSGEQNCEAQLSLAGSGVTGTICYWAVSSTQDKRTISGTYVLTGVSANAILRVEARLASGGGTVVLPADTCRVFVKKL